MIFSFFPLKCLKSFNSSAQKHTFGPALLLPLLLLLLLLRLLILSLPLPLLSMAAISK